MPAQASGTGNLAHGYKAQNMEKKSWPGQGFLYCKSLKFDSDFPRPSGTCVHARRA